MDEDCSQAVVSVRNSVDSGFPCDPCDDLFCAPFCLINSLMQSLNRRSENLEDGVFNIVFPMDRLPVLGFHETRLLRSHERKVHPLSNIGFGVRIDRKTWVSCDSSPQARGDKGDPHTYRYIIKGSLGGETSVLRTFRMSGKELVKERVSQGKVS